MLNKHSLINLKFKSSPILFKLWVRTQLRINGRLKIYMYENIGKYNWTSYSGTAVTLDIPVKLPVLIDRYEMDVVCN